MSDIVPTVCTMELQEPSEDVGPYTGTLESLCQMADEVVTEMGTITSQAATVNTSVTIC